MCKHTLAALLADLLQLDLPEFYPGAKAEDTRGENTGGTDELTELDYYSSQLQHAM
jgi:hypothetical protein